MSHIKVLGTGCANCKTTLKLIEDVAAEKGVSVQLEKVEDIQAIMGYGVMSTPGVVIDGKVVHAGGVPSREKIAGWLAGTAEAPAAPASSSNCCSGGNCG
ncbi:MAG: thioredoxin family protein [Thiobacillus sp.]|nr:TM0996/MTH895 family glutaredoxin-like protein [Gammaproteobacteria bacterium]MDO9009639.1 thioredoxin family protein [Thiobacillus sp.]MDP1923223.1 thioredoxin family protein [Thiobacillus sp.]MDP3124902.1 thioredoxin family protein [Thiobacillus sp.]